MEQPRFPSRHWLALHGDLSILDQYLLGAHHHLNLRESSGPGAQLSSPTPTMSRPSLGSSLSLTSQQCLGWGQGTLGLRWTAQVESTAPASK